MTDSGLSYNQWTSTSGVPVVPSLSRVQTLPDAAYTFKQSDSGSLFLLSTITAARTYTLPLVTGMKIDVCVTVAPGANVATFQAAANSMCGVLVVATSNDAAPVPTINGSIAASRSVVTGANTAIGDTLALWCDGVKWHCSSTASIRNQAAAWNFA